jgi:hypothetical protein
MTMQSIKNWVFTPCKACQQLRLVILFVGISGLLMTLVAAQ